MKQEFENALEELLNFKYEGESSAARYNEVFKKMVTASMQICGETDYSNVVQQKIDEAEKKYGAKMESADENDAYKKLREVVRFEMARESVLNNKEYEVCCTESNFKNATAKFRDELAKVIPNNQMEVLESMSYSLYSDFTKFFVCAVLDMIADMKIYQMKDFRPLQLNAMGKEVRTYVNVIRQQNEKPQKSQTVTDWFNTMMAVPAFLFKKLYGVSFVEMYDVPQKKMDDAAHLFNIFLKGMEAFCAGDEYVVLHDFLRAMNLVDCFTVRPKANKNEKPVVN